MESRQTSKELLHSWPRALDGSMLSLFRVAKSVPAVSGKSFWVCSIEWGMGIDVSMGDLNRQGQGA